MKGDVETVNMMKNKGLFYMTYYLLNSLSNNKLINLSTILCPYYYYY